MWYEPPLLYAGTPAQAGAHWQPRQHYTQVQISPPPSAAPQVDSLEQALAAQDPAPLLAELESCQARLRQSQAACGSKDAALRELRERLEQQTRCAGLPDACGWCAACGWPKCGKA